MLFPAATASLLPSGDQATGPKVVLVITPVDCSVAAFWAVIGASWDAMDGIGVGVAATIALLTLGKAVGLVAAELKEPNKSPL